MGQIGGWDLERDSDACIIALWRDEDAYRFFMESVHDGVVHWSGQNETYSAISVALSRTLFGIPGKYASLFPALSEGGLVRLADCRVKRGRENLFEEKQRTIWNPGMAVVDGMLAGLFSRSLSDERRYYVLTLWSSADSHRVYTRGILPSLREKARVEDDIEEISGRQIHLTDSWSIHGKPA